MNVQLLPLLGEDILNISFAGPSYFIGRSEECDLQLDNINVSRRHCELFVDRDELFVRDLESKNGTFVNGQLIHEKHLLMDGDSLGVPNTIYRVRIPSENCTGNLYDRLRRVLKDDHLITTQLASCPSDVFQEASDLTGEWAAI